MPTDVQSITAHCPDLSARTVHELVDRLHADYLTRFNPPQVAQHLRGLAKLSSDEPVQVLISRGTGDRVDCAVLAFDHPFEFSLITGVLAGAGLRIESGEVFTLRPPAGAAATRRPIRRFATNLRTARVTRDPLKRAVIVDHFTGQLDQPVDDFGAWADALRQHMTEVIGLLDRGDEASVTTAKRRVNEMVTGRLSRLNASQRPALAPVELSIDQVTLGGSASTRLRIVAQDTPAFLYSLSTALSLHGLSIERVRIGSVAGRVEDELYVVDAAGRPITDPALLERVRLSVLLTKQFTYFLDKAPDPFAALTRFEKLSEQIMALPQRGQWVELLGDPRAMQDLARLLGASNYLWEDFIRQQYETLLPIFRPHVRGQRFAQDKATLPLRLAEALDGAVGLAEQQDRLNKFKDSELFRIDLDHILTPGSDFRDLSERLTLLAEHLVATAARLVYDDLVRSYGQPRSEAGKPCPYAVFGLGKLGGVALGYASDIELMFIYAGQGKTTGGKRDGIACAEFYERLAKEAAGFIRTKREGIFQVDMRLRPHGNDGPLAVSLDQFHRYYGPGGQAHAFEKLALVRLRWIGGDSELGYAVEQWRDHCLYEKPDLDLDALWDIWNKQHAQKRQGDRLNAKYSPGALVDLEGTVQLLQVMHAAKAPHLRTPRLHEAIEALRRAGVLDERDYADLAGGYRFLRRLINALRMLRGNAQDLFLPPAGSDELVHLARRMGYEPEDGGDPAAQLSREFDQHTAAVRAFVRKHFDRACPGEAED